jgi:hypothetical protein
MKEFTRVRQSPVAPKKGRVIHRVVPRAARLPVSHVKHWWLATSGTRRSTRRPALRSFRRFFSQPEVD